SSFSLFLAATATLAKDNSLPNDLRDKRFFVLGAALRNQFIERTLRRNALQQLLKLALRIYVHRFFCQLVEIGASLGQNEVLCHLKAAVEVKGANERFECIGQSGGSFPASAGFVTTPHHAVLSETEGCPI